MRRVAVAVLACLGLVVTGCSMTSKPQATPTAQTAATTVVPSVCKRPRYADVVGTRPATRTHRLDRYPNDRASCAGIWLPRINDGFVPQGLALDRGTAWVSGWTKTNTTYKHQICQLIQIDLKTGKLLRYARLIKGYVGRLGPTVCRHGDGVDVTSQGVWVTETDRIWLLDPRRVGKSRMIKRSWRIVDPLRGAVATIHDGQYGMATFDPTQKARVDWFSIDDLMARGAIQLVETGQPDTWRDVPGIRTETIPSKVQGMTVDAKGRLNLARSTSRCAGLVVGKRTLGFLPGAEDFEYDGEGSLWALSETASLKVLSGGDNRPLVPSLVRFDVSKLMKGHRSRCTRNW